MSEYELKHYGVKGMKWGVRRDARMLANARRNKQVHTIKNDYNDRIQKQKALSKATKGSNPTVYKLSKLTEADLKRRKKAAIKEANAGVKKSISDTKIEYKATKSKEERDQFERDISKQAVSEIPNYKVKKIAGKINNAYTGYCYAVSLGGVALATLAFGPNPYTISYGASMVAGSAVQRWLVQKGLDKLT